MTRKLILIFISIIFTIINLYSYENEYKIIRDANIYSVSDIENKKIGIIKKGAICKLVNFSTKREYDNEDKIFKILIKIKSEEIDGWIFSDNLENKEGLELNKDMIGNWTYPYYQEAILKNDENIILKNEFNKEEMYTEKAFWGFFNPKIFIITNTTISYSTSMAEPVCFINKIIKVNDNEFKIEGIDGFTHEEVNLTIKLVNKRLKILNWNNFNWDNLIKIKDNELYNKLKLLRDNALSKFLEYLLDTFTEIFGDRILGT